MCFSVTVVAEAVVEPVVHMCEQVEAKLMPKVVAEVLLMKVAELTSMVEAELPGCHHELSVQWQPGGHPCSRNFCMSSLSISMTGLHLSTEMVLVLKPCQE